MDLNSRKDFEASSRRNGDSHTPSVSRSISDIKALQVTGPCVVVVVVVHVFVVLLVNRAC